MLVASLVLHENFFANTNLVNALLASFPYTGVSVFTELENIAQTKV